MNSKIKIIKKNKLKIKEPSPVSAKDLKRIKTREMSSTVSDWVSEMRLRRCEETKQNFEHLFTQNQQTI